MTKAKRSTPRCTGETKRGRPCRSSSVEGTDPPLCATHGGRDDPARPKKAAMLAALGELGNVTAAARSVGVSRATHYLWLDDDPDYGKAAAVALDQAADLLEAEARRRAVEGVTRPVLHKGEQVMIDRGDGAGPVPLIEHAYSDTLLIFLLKGERPGKFRERFDLRHSVGERDPDRDAALRRLVQSPEALEAATKLAAALESPEAVAVDP